MTKKSETSQPDVDRRSYKDDMEERDSCKESRRLKGQWEICLVTGLVDCLQPVREFTCRMEGKFTLNLYVYYD